jgi:diketogulonate reductase-like aldo/keto reductase
MAASSMVAFAGALQRNATSVALSNGVLLPLVGFGCAGMVRRQALQEALSVGYELFDTAQVRRRANVCST